MGKRRFNFVFRTEFHTKNMDFEVEKSELRKMWGNSWTKK